MKVIVIFTLIILISFGCQNKRYAKYNADWIVTEFELEGKDARHMIGFYNFKIDLERGIVKPVGLYLENEKLMKGLKIYLNNPLEFWGGK